MEVKLNLKKWPTSIFFAVVLLSFTTARSQDTIEKILANASAAVDSSDYDRAFELYYSAVTQNSRNIDALFGCGYTLLRQQKFAEAMTYFDKVLMYAPDIPSAYLNRGICYMELGQFENALNDFYRTEKFNVLIDAVYANRGDLYMKQFLYSKALKEFDKALLLQPNDTYLLNRRGKCYILLDELALAEKDILTILAIDSTDETALTNLAFCYLLTERYELADSLYTKIYSQGVDEAYFLNNYGLVKHKLGATEEGLNMISRSLVTDPENSYAYRSLALIYIDLGEFDKACYALERGLALGFTEEFGAELEDLKKQHCEK